MTTNKDPSYLSVAYSYSDKPKSEYPDKLMHHIMHDLLDMKDGTAVDVGCGRGDQVNALERLGFHAIGIDRDTSMQTITEHHQCDVIKDPFPLADNTADFVFSKSVIEHLYMYEMEHFFSEMKRITKPGGVIFLSTPDWKYCYKTFYNTYTHCTPFTDRSMTQCLLMHGLVDVKTHSHIALPGTWTSASLKLLSDLTLHSPCPHSWGKWFRWSKERQLFGWGRVNK